jgi:hypothetical protein
VVVEGVSIEPKLEMQGVWENMIATRGLNRAELFQTLNGNFELQDLAIVPEYTLTKIGSRRGGGPLPR